MLKKEPVPDMIGVRVSPADREALDRIAARRGVRVSRVVRDAIAAVIDADTLARLSEREAA